MDAAKRWAGAGRRATVAAWGAFNRWDVLLVLGAWLLGLGVWEQWGLPWARMVWGVLMLGTTALHGWSLKQRKAASR